MRSFYVVQDDDLLAANWLADGAERMAHDGNDGNLCWLSSMYEAETVPFIVRTLPRLEANRTV